MEPAGYAPDLRTGISGDLASALAAVIEASGTRGFRYDARVRRMLVQTIAARAYGRPLLELAILIGAADRLSGRGGYIGYFWGNPNANAGVFRAQALTGLERASAPGITVEAGELVFHTMVPAFRIGFSRMPFLAALLDFCVTALGFETVDREIAALLKGPCRRENAQQLANALSRQLYDFLKQHLPSQQYERKFRILCDFLGSRTGRRPTADAVDDASILAFWEHYCAGGGTGGNAGGDFRGFRTVALDCLRLRTALDTAETRRAIEGAAPIGLSRACGEVDPADVLHALEVTDGERAILSELAAPPASRLKSVNKREAARLDMILEAGKAATLLPLTLLRAEVFGAHQARITQAMRKSRSAGGKGAPAPSPATLINAAPEEDYGNAIAACNIVAARLQKVRTALMYILFRNLKAEAFTIAFDLFPDEAAALKADIREAGADNAARASPDTGTGVEAGAGAGNVVALRPGQAAEQTVTTPAVAALVRRAASGIPGTAHEAVLFRAGRDAFARINRQGFDENLIGDCGIVEAAETSAPLLRVCSNHMRNFLDALDRHFDLLPAEEIFASDCRRFRAAFAMLYRGPE